MNSLRGAAASLLSLAAVVACSSSSSSRGATGLVSATSAEAESTLAQYCDFYKPCCQLTGLPSDGVYCRAQARSAGPSLQYDPRQAKECLEQLRIEAAGEDFCIANGGLTPHACQGVFTVDSGGTRLPGEQCTTDADCARSAEGYAFCMSNRVTRERTCILRTKGKEGDEDCIGTVQGGSLRPGGNPRSKIKGYDCYVTEGLYCNNSTGACTKLVPLGGACTADDPCVAEAFCDGRSETCLERHKDGVECSANSCAKGLRCDNTSRKCTPLKTEGEACSAPSECRAGFCDGKCVFGGGFSLICGK